MYTMSQCINFTVKFIHMHILQSLLVVTEGVPNSHGYYVFAEGDKTSIDSAFNRAVEIIESNFLDERL